MTEVKQSIINEILKDFKYNDHFENDNFIYWIREKYIYNGDEFTREEFKAIQQYVIDHGAIPSSKFIEGNENSFFLQTNNNANMVFGYHHQRVLRYSKKYDSLEMYDFDTNIKRTYRSKSNRILVISKRDKLLSVNSKNYVLMNGNRWLSLKNWSWFSVCSPFKVSVVKLLMETMLGGKEWVSNLDPENSISLTNKNSRKANSLEEAITLECGAKPVKLFSTIFDTDTLIKMYRLIEPNKVHKITTFLKRNRINIEKLTKGSYVDKHTELLFFYFLTKDNRCERHVVMDYFRMLQEEGKKINLSISSYKTLKRNHDILSRKIMIKKLKSNKKLKLRVSKIYPEIESLPEMKVEQIKTIKRLNKESEALHHCVHGYSDRINKGECSIYSVAHNDQKYTLQINAEKVYEKNSLGVETLKKTENGECIYKFKIEQLKGKYNCDAPESIRKSLDLMCENHDISSFDKGSAKLRVNVFEEKENRPEKEKGIQKQVRAERVVKKKKEIVQIGEGILAQLTSGLVRENPSAFEEGYLPF